MNYCAAQPQPQGIVSSITAFIDCQSEALGSGAWAALALPGSSLSLVLTGFLTIFIAIIGYNLLFGERFTVRSGTLAMVKIGIVLALATSWPAWRTLVYDLVVDGPAQLVAEIGHRAGIRGSDGSLAARLDQADRSLAYLAVLGAGNPQVNLSPQSDPASAQLQMPPPFAGFNAFALGGGRILYLISAIAGLGIVRVVAGLMLALGPFFVAFLLFENTRSLFEGWVRVIAGVALGAIAAPIVLGLQLALLEPWLAGLAARRQAEEALPSMPVELFVVVAVFALMVAAVLIASVRLARGFRLAPGFALRERDAAVSISTASEAAVRERSAGSREERARAANVVDMLVSAQVRDSGRSRGGESIHDPQRAQIAGAGSSGRGEFARANTPSLGRSHRRTRSRVSASAAQRDRRS